MFGRRFSHFTFGLLLATLGFQARDALAIVYSWTGSTGGIASGSWTTTTNWSGATLGNGVDNTADFSTLDITGDSTITLDANRTIGNILFGDLDASTAAGWTLAKGAGNRVLTLRTTAGSAPDISVGALGGAKAATISVAIAGSNGLGKSGAGTLVLSAANTFTGGVNLNQGILSVGVEANLGDASNSLTFNGGTLRVTGTTINSTPRAIAWLSSGGGFDIAASGNTFTVDQNLTLGGGLTKSGAGTLVLTGVNSYTGGTTIAAGKLVVTTDNNLGESAGPLTISGGTLQIQGTDYTSNARSLTLAGAATLDIADAANSFLLSSALSGTGNLSKQGPGTLLLGSPTTASGSFSIGVAAATGGAVRLLSDNAAPSGALSIVSGTLELNGFAQTFNGPVTLGGGTAGSAAVLDTHGGLLTLGGNVTYANTNNPNGAVISGNAAGGLDLGALSHTFTVNHSTANTSTPDLTISAKIAGVGGSLVKTGAGTLALAGVNTYSGGTTLSGGVTQVSAEANLGDAASPLTFSGGALQVLGQSYTGTSRSINLAAAGTLNVADAGNTFTSNASLSGTGSLTKLGPGTLLLAGVNTASGNLLIGSGVAAGGIVKLQSNNVLPAGAISILDGTLDLNGWSLTTNGTLTLGGGGAGASALLDVNGGVLTLGGNVTFSAANNPNGAAINSSAGGAIDLGAASRTFNIGHSTANVATPDLSIPLNIAGSGLGIVKTGAGRLDLGGTNTYSGGTTLNAGTVSVTSDAALGEADATLTFGGGTLRVAGTGYTALTRPVTLTGGLGFDIADAGNSFTVASALSGSGVFTKLGAGTLSLGNGGNSLSGALNIGSATAVGGVLRSDAANALPTGGVNIYAGTLLLNGQNLSTTGFLNFYDGPAGTSGTIDLGSGTLAVAANQNIRALGTTTLGGRIVGDAGSALALAAGNHNFNISVTSGADVGLTIATNITGAGALAKAGNGTLAIAGSSTYTGGTAISAGVLQLGDGLVNGSIPGNVTNNGVLRFANPTSLSFTGVISGMGDVVKTGAGALVLTNSNSYAGATLVSGGTLRASAVRALGYGGLNTLGADVGTTTVASGATLDLNGLTVNEPIILTGGLLTNTASGAAKVDNGVAGIALSDSGAGIAWPGTTISFAGGGGANAKATINSLGLTANSFTLAGGTGYAVGDLLTITGGGAAAANRAQVQVTAIDGVGGIAAWTLTIPGQGYTGAPTGIANSSTSSTASGGALAGNAANFGLVALSASVAGSGYTSAPTVVLSSGTVAATAVLSSVTLANDSSIGGAGEIVIPAVVAGSGGLQKVGSAPLTLSGSNTYTGGTTVSEGTLFVNNAIGSALDSGRVTVGPAGFLRGSGTLSGSGPLSVAGVLAPGAGGTATEVLTVNVPVDFAPGGALNIGVRNAASSTAAGEPASPYDYASAYHDYLRVAATSGTTNLNNAVLNLAFTGTNYSSNQIITLISQEGDGQASGPELAGAFAGLAYSPTGTYFGHYANTDWWLFYRVESDGLNLSLSGNDVIITNIPEPSTIVMLLSAATAGMGIWGWRRRQRPAATQAPDDAEQVAEPFGA